MTTMTTRRLFAVLPLMAALAMGGCLQKETTHTLYLSPDGAVAWVALETDVHSDENDRAEEQTYLASASGGTHDVAQGLAALDPVSQRTQVLRATRPFTVRTDAQFIRIDRIFERMLYELRVPGEATLTRMADKTKLVVRMDIGAAMADGTERESPLAALVADIAAYRIVLTDGRFVGATGFTLTNNDTCARPIDVPDSDVAAKGGVIELSLSWR